MFLWKTVLNWFVKTRAFKRNFLLCAWFMQRQHQACSQQKGTQP
jgi:hypothetical protein